MSERRGAPKRSPLAVRMQEYIEGLQEQICRALEELDGKRKFREDRWERPGGGGGRARVIEDGALLEKGGVNSSAVHGLLPETMAETLQVPRAEFFASGISLVLHPRSPMIPTVHANFRYFEREGGDFWFGGGIDLTPYYPFEEDIVGFHRTLKGACDAHGADLYPRYKKWCDEYFFLRHRNETRGVGGIFFDYLRGDGEKLFSFVRSVGDTFLPAYTPIVLRRAGEEWGERERAWQLVRRGRYVEFNLLYDRGTAFGLETGGRVESILMSLPPLVRWGYDVRPDPGSREARLLALLSSPREWV
ncbi:MAG: oxygen-dependent coproporphyrinogen oxidase [Bacteroidota bacterium]